MRLLTDKDRAYILEQLTLAPDSVLADAMLAFNAIRDKVMAVRKLNETPTEPIVEKAAATVVRHNINPGPSAITRIGGDTKDELLRILGQGNQPPAKFVEHLKLLWARGEVKFDGQIYYL